jgi:predicted nucleotidyltransferase
MDLKTLLSKLHLDDTKVLNVYQYGSRVYGTHSDSSDYDFTIILSDDYTELTKIAPDNTIRNDNLDANVFHLKDYKQLIDEHKMPILENGSQQKMFGKKR